MFIGGTKIGYVIRHVLIVFPKSDEDIEDFDLEDLEQLVPSYNKVIIFVIDGDDYDEDVIEVVQVVVAINVWVYIIGIGSQFSIVKIFVVSEEGFWVGWVNSKDGVFVFSDLNISLLCDIVIVSVGDSFVYG